MNIPQSRLPGVIFSYPLLSLMLALAASPAQAASISASSDTFVSSGEANTNFGNKGAVMIAAPTVAQNRTEYGLVRFDTSAIKQSFDNLWGIGGWTVSSASLAVTSHHYLEGEQPSNVSLNQIASGDFELNWMSNDSWNENSVTWNNLNTGTLESLGAFNWKALSNPEPGGVHASEWSLNLTTGLLNDLLNGSKISMLGKPLANSTVSFQFDQLKAPDHAAAVLNITATPIPEPNSATLFGAGIGMLMIFRFRRTNLNV